MTDSVHQVLERSDDSNLRNIRSSHRDLVVAYQVNPGEYLHASEVGREVLNVRYWVPVRYCGIIETPVISARPAAPRGFWHHV